MGFWAVSEFDETTIFGKRKKIEGEYRNTILEFVEWAVDNFYSFNEDIFLDKEALQAAYRKLHVEIIDHSSEWLLQ